jgi:hypothetical protein
MPNGKYITSFWDPKGLEKNENYLDKGDSITALIKPQMFWVAAKQFGISWVCTQIRVHKQQRVKGSLFVKTNDDVADAQDEEETEEIEGSEEEEETEEVEVEVDA